MKNLLFLLVLFVSYHSKAQVSDSTQKEILIVYFSWSPEESSSIHYFFSNDSVVVETIPARTKEQKYGTLWLQFNNKLISKVFNDLYKQGWRLILFNQDDNTYFFERIISK